MGDHDVYQAPPRYIRTILKPNPGENFEGQVAHKFLDYLGHHPGFITRRELFRATHAYDKGPSIADRALNILVANGDVVQTKCGRQTFLFEAAFGPCRAPRPDLWLPYVFTSPKEVANGGRLG